MSQEELNAKLVELYTQRDQLNARVVGLERFLSDLCKAFDVEVKEGLKLEDVISQIKQHGSK